MARLEEIIAIVSQYRKIEVNTLAEMLSVSNVTVRKDLDKLEERGIIHRQHGFALLNNTDNINFRLALNHDVKKKIALKAAEAITDGETIMIESGSTCALLAEELALHKKNITIITNSVFIASYVRKSENVKIILIGGEYQPTSQVNVGPLVKRVIDEFYVNKFFIGIDGIDEKRGFRSNDIERSDTTHLMAQAAENVIILTDSTKFERNGVITEFNFSEVHEVYTDSHLSSFYQTFLKDQQVKVTLV